MRRVARLALLPLGLAAALTVAVDAVGLGVVGRIWAKLED